jgi:hypothetical protein
LRPSRPAIAEQYWRFKRLTDFRQRLIRVEPYEKRAHEQEHSRDIELAPDQKRTDRDHRSATAPPINKRCLNWPTATKRSFSLATKQGSMRSL